MKLRNLNGLIRKNEGPPKMRFTTAHGELVVGLVKGELLAGLAALHADPMEETGLTLVDGFVVHEDDEARLTAARRQVEILAGTASASTYTDLTIQPEPDLDLLADADEDDEDELDLLA